MEHNTTAPPTTTVTEKCLSSYLSMDHQLLVSKVSLVLQICVIPLFALWIALSNIIVIVAIWTFNSAQKPCSWITSSQAFSDVITGVAVLPLQLAVRIDHLRTSQICYFESVSIFLGPYFYFQWLSTLGTLGNLAIYSVDRFYAVKNPHRYRAVVTIKKVQKIIALFWLLVSTLEVILFEFDVWFLNVVLVAACILFIIIFQYLVLKAFRQHNASVASSTQGPSEFILKQEKKMAKRISVLIAALCISSLPMVTAGLIGTIVDLPMSQVIGPWVLLIFHANSALNPFLYYWKHPNIRQAVKKLLGKN